LSFIPIKVLTAKKKHASDTVPDYSLITLPGMFSLIQGAHEKCG